MNQRTEQYGGLDLGVIEMGAAVQKTFILVHGIGVSSRYFMPLALILARSAKVYVLDLPGFGRMSKPNRSLSINDYARLISKWMEKNTINNPVLVGNSMGCQIVAEMLTLDPFISEKAVLIGPVINDKERSFFKQSMRLFQDGFHEPAIVNWIVFSDYWRCGPKWYFKTFPHMLNYPIEEKMRKINAKLLVMRGAKDPIVPRRWTERLVSASRSASSVEIKDVGHIAMYKQAYDVSRHCLDF